MGPHKVFKGRLLVHAASLVEEDHAGWLQPLPSLPQLPLLDPVHSSDR